MGQTATEHTKLKRTLASQPDGKKKRGNEESNDESLRTLDSLGNLLVDDKVGKRGVYGVA